MSTDTPGEPEPAAPLSPLSPLSPPSAEAPGRPGRRLLPLVLAAAVLVAAAGGATAYAALHHGRTTTAAHAAPRPSGPPSPSFGARSGGAHFGSLRDLLLPVPDGYSPGPDDGALGNDTALTGSALSSHLADLFPGVPDADRRTLQREFGATGIHAYGLRTYRDMAGELDITMSLVQMTPAAARSATRFDTALFQASGAGRKGPTVPGHPEAHCYLPPTGSGDSLSGLLCFAAAGDLLATMTVEGPDPLDGTEPARLYAAQLDRIAIPGTQA